MISREIRRTDWTHDLLGVSSAIRHYYGLACPYPENETVRKWLDAHHFRCVITFLIDAMGAELIRKYVSEDAFVSRYMAEAVPSVYPPTTTAATTAFLTGKSPKESGWLGWHQYFSEIDDDIILFLGRSQYGDRQYGDYAYQALPVEMIYDELNRKGIKADSIWPSFGHNGCKHLKDQCDLAVKLLQDPELRYVYVYWDELDEYMHIHGPSSPGSGKMMTEISEILEHFSEQLPEDTGMMVIADHGQVDVENIILSEDRELYAMLERKPSLEARTTAFFVKPDKKKEFQDLFEKKYGKYFSLYTKEEVIASDLFGKGRADPLFPGFIGDFISIADTEMTLVDNERQCLRGHHAGALKDEAMIPVILFPGKENV